MILRNAFASNTCQFLKETDEFRFYNRFRSPETNRFLLKAMHSPRASNFAFNADSKLGIIDCGDSSSATSMESYFIEGACKPLKGVTASGISSGLEASGCGSVLLPLKDDNNKSFDMQIDKVPHLKGLPTTLLIPQHILQQHRALGNSHTLHGNILI